MRRFQVGARPATATRARAHFSFAINGDAQLEAALKDVANCAYILHKRKFVRFE